MLRRDHITDAERKQVSSIRSEQGLKSSSDLQIKEVVANFVRSGLDAYFQTVTGTNKMMLPATLLTGFDDVRLLKEELVAFRFQYFWGLAVTSGLSMVNNGTGFVCDLLRLGIKLARKIFKSFDGNEGLNGLMNELLKMDEVSLASTISRFINFLHDGAVFTPSFYSSYRSCVRDKEGKLGPRSLGNGNSEWFGAAAIISVVGLAFKFLFVDRMLRDLVTTKYVGKENDKIQAEIAELNEFYRSNKATLDDDSSPGYGVVIAKINLELTMKIKEKSEKLSDGSWKSWFVKLGKDYMVPFAVDASLMCGVVGLGKGVIAEKTGKLVWGWNTDNWFKFAGKSFTAMTFFLGFWGFLHEREVKGTFTKIGIFCESAGQLVKRTCCSSNCFIKPSTRPEGYDQIEEAPVGDSINVKTV